MLKVGSLYRRIKRSPGSIYTDSETIELVRKDDVIAVLEYIDCLHDGNVHRWKVLTTTGILGTYTAPLFILKASWQLLKNSNVTKKD